MNPKDLDTMKATFVTTFYDGLACLIEYMSSRIHVYHLVTHMHDSCLSAMFKICISYAIFDTAVKQTMYRIYIHMYNLNSMHNKNIILITVSVAFVTDVPL